MKVYRNHYSAEGGGSGGYSFHASKVHAKRAVKEVRASQQEQFEQPHEVGECLTINMTRAGVIDFLNTYAGHADNG